MKIASKVDKKFAIEAKVELVVLKLVMIDGVDGVNECNRVNKYRKIALL